MGYFRKLVRWFQQQEKAFRRERRIRLYSLLFALSMLFYLSSEMYVRDAGSPVHTITSRGDTAAHDYHETYVYRKDTATGIHFRNPGELSGTAGAELCEFSSKY